MNASTINPKATSKESKGRYAPVNGLGATGSTQSTGQRTPSSHLFGCRIVTTKDAPPLPRKPQEPNIQPIEKQGGAW